MDEDDTTQQQEDWMNEFDMNLYGSSDDQQGPRFDWGVLIGILILLLMLALTVAFYLHH